MPLLSINFAGLTPGVMTSLATLSGGVLAFTRSGAGAGQTSASTHLVTGLNTDVALVRQRGAAGTAGMAHRPSRTNSLGFSRTTAGFTAGSGVTTTAGYAASPDGTTNGTRYQVASGGYSPFSSWSGASNIMTYSLWGLIGLGSASSQAVTGANGFSPIVWTLTNAWQLRSVTDLTGSNGTRYLFPADGRAATGGLVAGARDAVHDLLQQELGQYATDSIITPAGSAVVRVYERVVCASPASLVTQGRLEMQFRLLTYGAAGDFATDDATNYLYTTNDGLSYCSFNTTTKKFSVVCNGGTAWNPATVVAWNAGDTLDVKVAAGGTTLNSLIQYQVNGGGYTSLGNSGAAQGAIGTASPLNVLGGQSAGSFAGDVQTLAFYPPGSLT